MEPQTILVFAGNMQQFSEYAKTVPKPTKCVYVTRPRDFYGIRNFSIVIIGEFGKTQRDYDLLDEAKKYQGVTV